MVQRLFMRLALFAVLLSAATVCGAVSFASADGAFSWDLPAGWSKSKNPPAGSVLSIQKADTVIDIKTTDCKTETCIEEKITTDLTDVKNKKMKVVGNSYTGEEIRRIEFSTGEPFFYISFFSPKSEFSAGYFLIDGHSYSILARNLTYAETDLIFSFISPKQTQRSVLEMDLKDKRAYDISPMPHVSEEMLENPEAIVADEPPAEKPAPVVKKDFSLQKVFKKIRIKTLVSPNMPPYIRHWGHFFDIVILIGVLFILLQVGALITRLCLHETEERTPANPNSLYPIFFERLYGTPSLIFRAKDNQGNILISLSSRWDSFFLLTGLLMVAGTFLLLAVAGFGENSGLIPLSAFAYNTIYSACSLFIPLGIVIFFCGIVWSQLVLREITLFDRKGKRAAILVQKGFGLKQERYDIYFARSKEVLVATRKRFSLLRMWALHTKDGQLVAQITETSLPRALVRKCLGHLSGFLRADYVIEGQMDSAGTIDNTHMPFDAFSCQLDKPQAINARDLLATTLLINIRDKDKWYPWFN